MSKHTVLVAVTVDTKYTASDVASELVYFLPFITSECLDTVLTAIPARIKKQVKSYQVWNADHVAMYCPASCDEFDCDTHKGLLSIEKETGCSFSSFVTTDDIQSVVDAVQNEWNGDLLYEEVTT